VTDSVVKSAGELYKHLSDEEIQEGWETMNKETDKRLQWVLSNVLHYSSISVHYRAYYNVTDALAELCESREL